MPVELWLPWEEQKNVASRYLTPYESDNGKIDLSGIARLATILRVPAAYLVAEDDIIADAIIVLSKLPYEDRRNLARRLKLEADTFAGQEIEGGNKDEVD